MQLTRRQLLAMSAAAAAFAACGEEDSADSTVAAGRTARSTPSTAATPSTRPSPSSPTTSLEPFPRTVGRGFARTTINHRPERIVATADRDQLDVLLAIGLTPVLYGQSGDYETVAPWLDPALVAGVEAAEMAGAFEPNLEAIAAARPDLIVDAWADESVHRALSRIAPTIQIKLDNTDSWQAAQRLTGEATGLEDAAAVAIAETEAVLAEHATHLAPLAGRSVAVAFLDAGELVMIPGNEIGGRIFTELGLTVHPTPDGVSGRYSIENVAELLGNADTIVSFDAGAGTADQATSPLFAQLPAVVAGRYVLIDSATATACYQESTLSVRWAAPRLAQALLA